MNLPRLRRNGMRAEKGGPKRASKAVTHILRNEPFTIHVSFMDDTVGVSPTGGTYVAWVEQCGEDEFGMLARGDTPEHALWRLSSDLQRIIHKARPKMRGTT